MTFQASSETKLLCRLFQRSNEKQRLVVLSLATHHNTRREHVHR